MKALLASVAICVCSSAFAQPVDINQGPIDQTDAVTSIDWSLGVEANNRVCRFNDSGTSIKSSVVELNDFGDLAGVRNMSASGQVLGGTLVSEALTPGRIVIVGDDGILVDNQACLFANDALTCATICGHAQFGNANAVCATSQGLIFEGATADLNRATLNATDPAGNPVYYLQALPTGAYNVTAQQGTLTSPRVPYAAANGTLADAAGLSWANATSTLTATNLYVSATTTPIGRTMIPMGELSYVSTTGVTITIANQSDGLSNLVPVVIPTTLNVDSHGFDNGGADNGRLRYIGAVSKHCHIAGTFSLSPTALNDIIVVAIARNGSVLPRSRVFTRPGSPLDSDAAAIHVMAPLSQNQYIEFYVGNYSGPRNVVVKTVNLFGMCI